ncbi:MAG TPA: reverse transcriptase family protein [Terracidiphilus sp.]
MTRWSITLPASVPKSYLVQALARALAHGEPREEDLVARAAFVLGREWRWLLPVARRYIEAFGASRPRVRQVRDFILSDPAFQRAWERRVLRLAQPVPEPHAMHPAPFAANWGLPDIPNLAALAQWLRLSPSELEWFADQKGLLTRRVDTRLRHYSYRLLRKSSGGMRLIEAPKQHMRAIQRQILREILESIPVHAAAHGFVKGRSIRTFAALHAGRAVVLRMDLMDFFPSFTRARVQALFRMCGYPEGVADLVGGLCTSVAPRSLFAHLDFEHAASARELYGRAHLPQGAPTSPALANVCAYRMDCRLEGLARTSGAVYTRYADDLAFSGDEDFAHRAERFAASVAAIALDENFRVHFRKTRIMRQGVRQHLAGLVVNAHLNVPRRECDLLKAMLTNCIRHGPAQQNRDGLADFRSHLQGRVSFVESINPARGGRLRVLFEQIQWTSNA